MGKMETTKTETVQVFGDAYQLVVDEVYRLKKKNITISGHRASITRLVSNIIKRSFGK